MLRRIVERLALALTPAGHLVLRPALEGEPALDAPLAGQLGQALARGAGHALLLLGSAHAHAALAPQVAFWRDLGRMFVASLCALPDLEARRERADPPLPRAELDTLLLRAPPLPGGEYLSPEVLAAHWAALREAWAAELAAHAGTVQAFLAARDPAWNLVGRVHLHLAERRASADPDHPFAFLATYTTGLGPGGKPVHRPLGDAVRAASSADDRQRLLALLAPVSRAAERCALVKELADTGRLFAPQAWSPAEAHRLLLAAPALEESGLVVKVPAWWRRGRPPRPQITVKVGDARPAGLGLDALLDFDVRVTVEGEPLTEAELAALRAGGDGLRLLKGRWVEVDRATLDRVLAHWEAAHAAAAEGLPFGEAMRLVAGTALSAGEAALAEAPGWVGVVPGAWLSEALATLRAPRDGQDDTDPGALLATALRPYQRDGVRWLLTLARLGLGGVLADDMGLGKTVQVLALLLLLRRDARRWGGLAGPHLLVAPASLLANWSAEARRFAPSLRVLVAHPSHTPRAELAALDAGALAAYDLVVTTYGSVHRLPWLAARRWGVAVLDEAQAVKNPGARQTRAVKGLRARVRLALTGTPVENRAGDLWSLFDFVNPGLLGSAREFTAFVRRAADAEAPADGAGDAARSPYAALRQLVRPYLLRRLKTDVLQDLPGKTEVKAFCGLTRRQAALYAESVAALARELKASEGGAAVQRRGIVLASLLRLKQLCNHPSQWSGDGAFDRADSGKCARLAEIAEVIAARGEKALVFTQFRELAAPLAGWLARTFGRPGLVLTGATRVKERAALVRRFQEDEAVPFLVLTLKAGGSGLNLTAATHVIHFDRWWNPAVEEQATDRAFRIGQTRPVLVHKLVCRGTVEERIDAMLEEKRGLARDLLEGGGEVALTELSDAELLRLVALDLRSATAA